MLFRTRKDEVVCEAEAGEAEAGVTGRGQLDEKESDGECKVLPLGPFTVFTLSRFLWGHYLLRVCVA